MSLAASDRLDAYQGNDSTIDFSYTFKILDQSYLRVIVTNNLTGSETVLVITTDYTVSGVGSPSGGTISLVDANQAWLDSSGNGLKTGYTITIIGLTPLTQVTDIRNQGPYYPKLHEDAFDKLTMILQEFSEELRKCFKLKDTDINSGDQIIYSLAKSRADKYLKFDSNGNLTLGDSSIVAEFGETGPHSFTEGASAANFEGETFDGSVYTSGFYYLEITRGTTVFSNLIAAIQYLNGSWRVVQGSSLSEELHGFTLSVSQTGTVGQLKGAADSSGVGNAQVKIKKHFFIA